MNRGDKRRLVRKAKKSVDPHEFVIEDEDGTEHTFRTIPILGTKVLDPIAQSFAGNIAAFLPAVKALLVEDTVVKHNDDTGEDETTDAEEGTAFRRFVDLDLGLEDELEETLEMMLEPYGLTEGESSASPPQSSDDEASSPSTSGDTTDSGSTTSSQTPEPAASSSST